ncbi:MAG: family 16 glycoside hydrolase [Gemmataceae bacterium]
MPPARSSVPPELADHSQYTDVRELGRGGMGVVYLATNRLLDRPEVLKVVSRQHLGKPGAADRFLREMRAAARLQHPNVVSAYSAAEVGDLLVFAMEYVPGQDLARVVQANGPLPVPVACRYAAQAAAGLQHAFEKGMAHRDVKPSNLILHQDGAKATVKVCDFGLAKATAGDTDDTDLTGAGRLLGTPEYLAPEQAADAARADHRADIYGLGCTLYFLLTARPPFRADGLLALIDAHRYETAVPLDQVRGDVPAELAAVVARMLAKNPAARFQTPGEVAKALAPFTKPGAAAPVVRPADTVPPADTAPKLPPVARPPTRPATIVGADLPVPARTAYLNPEDFDPPKKKPAPTRPKRKAQPAPNWTPAIVAGGLAAAVLVAAVGVLVVRFRQPGDDKAVAAVEPAAGPAAPAAPAPPQVPVSGRVVSDGFVPLFNGRDLAGWHPLPGQPNNWRVEDGVLVARGGSGRSHLISDGVLGDFQLRAEVRVNQAGNSGLFVRTGDQVAKTGSPADGYEVQINYSGNNGPPTGSIYVENKVVARLDAAAGRPDEWVRYEVIAVGDRLTVRVNGVTAVEYTDPVRRFTRGRIGLQQLNPDTVVEVRSIEVKELVAASAAAPPSPPPPPAPPAGTLVSSAEARHMAAVRNRWFKTTGKAIYRVEGKDLILDGSAGNFGWLFFGDPEWTDYDFSARVRDVRGLNGGTLFVRANHEYTGGRQANGAPVMVLRAGLFPFGFASNTAIAIEGYSSLGGFLSGEKYGLPRADLPNILRPNAWHTVRAKVRGKTVETYFDGRPIHRADPPMPARGMVGIRVVDSGAMRFTDLKVTDPAGKVLWQGLPDLPE